VVEANAESRRPVVAHLTPHRYAFEPRTFFECESLAAAGFDVVLVAPHETDVMHNGVRVRALPRYRNRLDRITRLAFLCVWRALREKPEVFHLHEPDLLPWGLLLRLLGKRVIYDVHEDYSTAALVRPWIPAWARRPLAGLVDLVTAVARRSFHIVIAEKYYARLFPGSLEVLNYARLEEFGDLLEFAREFPREGGPRLLYTGGVTDSRGGRHHLRLLETLPEDAAMLIIGHCGMADLAAELRRHAAQDARLELHIDESDWIPHGEIVAAYRRPWTAGIALFPDTPHYREKELTKFFEYMAAGLPILCSNFPVWRELVEGNGLGICVDPEDPEAAAEAALWLHSHPEEAQAMGERGRRLVREKFNWESQAEVLIAFYRRILGREQGVLRRV